MDKLKLGLQLFTVYDALRDNFEEGLQQFVDIGFRNMELAAYDPGEARGLPPLAWKGMSAKELKALADRLGIHFISASVSLPNTVPQLLETDFDWDREANFNSELGSMGPVYAMVTFGGKDDVLRLAEYCNRAGEACKRAGVHFFYHNHFHEFQRFDGEHALDILLANTDPDTVKVELDTYWAQRGGVDPIAYLNKLGTRCMLVHQKDISSSCGKMDLTQGAPAVIDMDYFGKVNDPDDYIEVGEGIMNVKGIISTLREIGAAEYIVIEQDFSKLSPVDSAKLSYRNMVGLMG